MYFLSMRHGLGTPMRLASLALLLVLLAAVPHPLCAQELTAKVDQILASPQSQAGEMTDQLVQLGASSVPSLIKRLDTSPYPMVIVEALGRLGDSQATFPLLNLLNGVEPFAEEKGEFHTQRMIVIQALGEIGDSRAEPLLQAVFNNEKGHIGTRLAAATALAGLGSPDVKEQARTFIMKIETGVHRGEYGNLHTSGPFLFADLDRALFAVGTDRARTILIERFLKSGLPDEKLTLVDLLAKRPDPRAAAALLQFCEKPDAEPYTQLQAARALVGLGQPYPQDRLLAALNRIRPRLSPSAQAELDKLRGKIP